MVMACSSSSSRYGSDLPVDPSSNFIFPKWEFVKTKTIKHSCQYSLFQKWNWFHYGENEDLVFCYVCARALRSKKMILNRGDARKGFCNWKDGTIVFKSHETSACHKETMQVIVLSPSCPGEMLFLRVDCFCYTQTH